MAAEAAPAHRIAPAKVNLTLHLRGRRADGFHLLDSLVVFPSLGDSLAVEPARGISLGVSGAHGDAISTGPDNLVLCAAKALARHHGLAAGAALHLVKTLPVAAGIGGGSSDAAAALHLLSRLWGVTVPDGLALSLGADVPVCCLAPRPSRMQGIGERLEPAPAMPGFWLVLVNPRVAVSTGAVFAGVADRSPPPGPPAPQDGFGNVAALVDWLRVQRNDLQAPAIALCPAVAQVLEALADAPLARMSGSGATCFALVEDEAGAEHLADRVRREHPDWWIAAAPVAAHDPGRPEPVHSAASARGCRG